MVRARTREGAADERARPVPVGRWVPTGHPAARCQRRPRDRSWPRQRPWPLVSAAGPAPEPPQPQGPPRHGGALGGRGCSPFGAGSGDRDRRGAVVLTHFHHTPPRPRPRARPLPPSAHVTASARPGRRGRRHPLPSADASSSVLASRLPRRSRSLDQIQATVRHGVASGPDKAGHRRGPQQPAPASVQVGPGRGKHRRCGPSSQAALKAKLAAPARRGRHHQGWPFAATDRELATALSRSVEWVRLAIIRSVVRAHGAVDVPAVCAGSWPVSGAVEPDRDRAAVRGDRGVPARGVEP